MPGLGARNVERIIAARPHGALRLDDLARLRVPLKKILPFVIAPGHHPRQRLDDPARLRAELAPQPRQASLF